MTNMMTIMMTIDEMMMMMMIFMTIMMTIGEMMMILMRKEAERVRQCIIQQPVEKAAVADCTYRSSSSSSWLS